MLLRRDVLTVPFAPNKFIRASYETSAKLWPSSGVCRSPAVSSSWTRDWCSCIVATDASEYGFGVCLKECEKVVCQTIGRTSERARFRKCRTNTIGARSAFFEHHRLGFDTCGDLIDLDENDDASAETRLIPVDNFPGVPLEIEEASGWRDVASGQWRYTDENIIVLESRALTRGIEFLASTHQLYRKTCVALVDNMSAALSFERRRSRNFLVLRCIRKFAGLCLAFDLAVTVRWIPSEVNVSDRPSRIHDPSDIRDKTVTSLLTTVVKGRTDHDELISGMMMVQRFPREGIFL